MQSFEQDDDNDTAETTRLLGNRRQEARRAARRASIARKQEANERKRQQRLERELQKQEERRRMRLDNLNWRGSEASITEETHLLSAESTPASPGMREDIPEPIPNTAGDFPDPIPATTRDFPEPITSAPEFDEFLHSPIQEEVGGSTLVSFLPPIACIWKAGLTTLSCTH